MTGIKIIAAGAATTLNGAMLSQVINHQTSITVAMFLGGIVLTVSLVWWVGNLVSGLRMDIHDVQRDLADVQKRMDSLYCVREAEAKCSKK
jgi:hypothetical protein